MPTITIRELRQLESESQSSFEAELSFDGGGRYGVTITDPFSVTEEQELEWYFERWLRRPFLDTVKAARAQESIRSYGEKLFDQVFADRKAYGAYDRLKGRLSEVTIEIEGESPAFQALHWEALRDSEGDARPLAVDGVMVRKMRQVASAQVNASPVVNLLVVIARPDEESDVGYRTISRPLVEAIRQSQLRVSVDIVRPGTYEAFVKQFQAKGQGYYHIVHFDMHGTLATYEQLVSINEPAAETENSALTYRRLIDTERYGREDFQPFEGVRAYLSFEGEAKGQMDLVEAGELAQLLNHQRIPVCLLNACQSGKQLSGDGGEGRKGEEGKGEGGKGEGETGEGLAAQETSLGSRLMAAGMQVVVAMGYSVTVSAARILMETLYAQLFAQGDVVKAIQRGRYELYARKARRAHFNMQVRLEDWMLPVVYANGAVDLNLRPFTAEEEEAYYEAQDGQYRFAAPTFGFVGRDLEILKIEKALLKHNVLLLRGMGGTGKTTLLNYLRGWWVDTHYAENIFYFGYDEKAYTLQQILHGIG
ncbi:MAG: CHAT domain-containing protein, partial [Cyanobacteria bacterium P01_F01_bin.53]